MTKGASERNRRIGGSSRHIAAWVAWSLCAVCVVLIGLALLLDFLTDEPPSLPGAPDLRPGAALAVLTGMLALAYPTVGALIASRLPANPVGWIFCGTGLLYAAQRIASAYADYALLETFAFPGGEYVAWFSTCLWIACLTLGVFLILLFPEGRLPTRRWRTVAWAAILGAALVTVGYAFMPEMLILTHPYVENPFGLVGVIGGRFTTYEVFGASRVIGMTLLLASTLAALFSSILRLHRARGQERQQLKWFLFAAVPLTVFLGLVELDLLISIFTHDFWYRSVDMLQSAQILTPVLFVLVLALLTVPFFTYIAILKHRLYDIDIIISRSLVYGALTVVIASIFEGVDAVAHYFVLAFTHQEESILSVIVAALAIAALFDPVKHRIRRFVDRRIFNEQELGESGQPERHPERDTTS